MNPTAAGPITHSAQTRMNEQPAPQTSTQSPNAGVGPRHGTSIMTSSGSDTQTQ